MHFLKAISGIASLYTLFTTCATMPALAPIPGNYSAGNLISRAALDKLAIVNVYSGGACDGDARQIAQTGGTQCYPYAGQSIQSSAKYADTSYCTSLYRMMQPHIFATPYFCKNPG